jgi:hypothetical protein
MVAVAPIVCDESRTALRPCAQPAGRRSAHVIGAPSLSDQEGMEANIRDTSCVRGSKALTVFLADRGGSTAQGIAHQARAARSGSAGRFEPVSRQHRQRGGSPPLRDLR